MLVSLNFDLICFVAFSVILHFSQFVIILYNFWTSIFGSEFKSAKLHPQTGAFGNQGWKRLGRLLFTTQGQVCCKVLARLHGFLKHRNHWMSLASKLVAS